MVSALAGGATASVLSLDATGGAASLTLGAGVVTGALAVVLSTVAARRAVSAAVPVGAACLVGGKILGVTIRTIAARMTKRMKRLSIYRLLCQGTGS
jgi:hypothetical protein